MKISDDVDIRYIQKMLGHSSIATTQIRDELARGKYTKSAINGGELSGVGQGNIVNSMLDNLGLFG